MCIRDRVFRWCDKCVRWSTTHNSDSHRGKTPSDSGTVPTANLAQAGNWLVPDPAAWMFDIPSSKPLLLHLLILAPLLPLLCLLSYLFVAWVFNASASSVFQHLGTAIFTFGANLPDLPFNSVSAFLTANWQVLLGPLSWSVPLLWLMFHQPHDPDPHWILALNVVITLMKRRLTTSFTGIASMQTVFGPTVCTTLTAVLIVVEALCRGRSNTA